MCVPHYLAGRGLRWGLLARPLPVRPGRDTSTEAQARQGPGRQELESWTGPGRHAQRGPGRAATGPSAEEDGCLLVVVLVVETALLLAVTARAQQRLGEREHGLLQGSQALAHVVVGVLHRIAHGLLELVPVRALLELAQDGLHGGGDVGIDLVELLGVVDDGTLHQLGDAPVQLTDLQGLRELVEALVDRLEAVVNGFHTPIDPLEVAADPLELALDPVDTPAEAVQAAADPVQLALDRLEAAPEMSLEGVETVGEPAELVVDLSGDLGQVRVDLPGQGLALALQTLVQGGAVRLDLLGEGVGQRLVALGVLPRGAVGALLDEGA